MENAGLSQVSNSKSNDSTQIQINRDPVNILHREHEHYHEH